MSSVGNKRGEIRREKLGPGRYRFHGPRGAVTYTRARSRSGTRTLTVWNPSDCTVPESLWNVLLGRTRTLTEATHVAAGMLCPYRPGRLFAHNASKGG